MPDAPQPRDTVHPRVHNAAWALERHGELARSCFAALERRDPIADQLVAHLAESPPGSSFELVRAWEEHRAGRPLAEPVRAFLSEVERLPEWVDWTRVDRARRLFERTGIFGGFVLSLRSLMGGYVAPAGNKPLAFSGRLREQAPRRVAETARFVTAVCAPEGLRPGDEGWRITLQVRLMHAQVRRLLLRSGRWDVARWAEPINQHDMLATVLLFSEVYVEGLRLLGFSIDEEEAEDWLHLWCLVGWLMGTDEELLPDDYAEAQRQREIIQGTQGEPDEDSRALAAALLGAPPHLSIGPTDASALGSTAALRRRVDRQLADLRLGMARQLSRMLIGDAVADSLAIAVSPGWSRVLPLVPLGVGAFERARTRVPRVEAEARKLGRRYWDWVVEMTLAGEPATFARPQRLAGV